MKGLKFAQSRLSRSMWLAGVSAAVMATPAYAQQGGQSGSGAANTSDIIVTARKREESIMKTPVVIQVIDQQLINDLKIDNPADLTSVVPGLQINYSSATAGATVNMRGLGNGAGANFAEQSTALNIDGATAPHGSFFRAGMFDIAQIEVLKGPQALFFGKSTSVGVVVINTADPTDQWEAGFTGGYEFDSDEASINGYVSGPITDKLGIRVAGLHSESQGWMRNPDPNAVDRRLPALNTDAVRLTLKYDDPESGLTVKFKGTLTDDKQNYGLGFINQGKCVTTFNAPYVRDYDNCKVDKYASGAPSPVPYNPNLNYDPFNVAAFSQGGPSPLLRQRPYSFTKTKSAIFNVDYEVVDDLTFTSLSSYLQVKNGENQTYPLASLQTLTYLGYANDVDEFTQEVRLTSDWKDKWFNFMLGGLYADGDRTQDLFFQISRLSIPGVGDLGLYVDNSLKFYSKTYSAFGQVLLTPVDKLELAVGGRYTKVKKGFTSFFLNNNYPAFFFPGSGESIGNVPPGDRSTTEDNFSPEVTLTYRPTDDLTAFISYKEGYKGQGFNADTTASRVTPTSLDPFAGETVSGFEGGIKAQLLDRQLSLTATGYRYNYDDLQVAFVLPGTTTVNIANGASVRVQGVELGADFRPAAVPGLSLSAFLNYNDTHYRSFPAAPCYGSQTAAQGCVDIGGGTRAQNLAGRTLHNAPEWLGTLSGDYSWDLSKVYTASIGARGYYSSSYNYTAELSPLGVQKSFVTLDASLHFGRSDRLWDVALLCRNCTDKVYAVNGGDSGAMNPGEISALFVNIAQTRQVMLQFTLRPQLH